jgi:hypothetical protein
VADLRAELWLANQLKDPTLFRGVTTLEIRRERVRAAILELRWGDRIAGGRKAGAPRKFREVFEQVYGEPLEPPKG